MSSDEEDEDAALQEQEVRASPDIEPVEELEEDRAEVETEVEEEDRESDEIEEREDEMTGQKSDRRKRPRKGGTRRAPAARRAKGQVAHGHRTTSKKH